MNNKNQKIEVLAPCGSYDILVAAIHAGADACYIGGNSFGARAYAENFDQETIKKAVLYAHLHGVKVYLTVNTLLKQEELFQLYDYIKPFYEIGGDALIIQDFGVYLYVKKQFPDIAIHCSTQMNITSRYGAAFMKAQGASRVVTAREMSLAEIQDIKAHVDIEIETFVHGAMCYSYSGQCLMSSLAGGRSGNRGRCAQPCRKCYDGSYFLSMKDMCTLKDIPRLVNAGIDSLKIEGRMKNAYYVASAVHAYRTMVDDYKNGCFDEKKAEALTYELANIYNRGGFSDGYFFRHNGADMISRNRPNNQGVCIGTLKSIGSGTIEIQLKNNIYKQDVLELTTTDNQIVEITSPKEGKAKEHIRLNCPKTKLLKKGQDIYRTKCPSILNHVEKEYINNYKKTPISFTLHAEVGKPVRLSASVMISDITYETEITGDVIEKSNHQQIAYDVVKKPFAQLGNTDYILSDFVCDADTDAFLPAGMLKKLRRLIIEKLEYRICQKHIRTAPEAFSPADLISDSDYDTSSSRTIIGVTTIEQYQTVLNYADRCEQLIITVPVSIYATCREMNDSVPLYIELPHVIHSKEEQYLQEQQIRGIYIRNIDGFAIANSLKLPEDCEILCDASLYCYNRLAHTFLRSNTLHAITFLTPRELNLKELSAISEENLCLSLYEYQPVMLTANCLQKNKYGCKHMDTVLSITDEIGNHFPVKTYCNECYNIIYNKIPYCILDKYSDTPYEHLHSSGYAIRFTIESSADTAKILLAFTAKEEIAGPKTCGHLYRGVL